MSEPDYDQHLQDDIDNTLEREWLDHREHQGIEQQMNEDDIEKR